MWNPESQLDLLPGKCPAYFLFHCHDSELPWFRQYIHRTHWHVLPVENYHTQEIFLETLQNYRIIHLKNTLGLIKGSRSIACCIKPEKSTVHPHHHHNYAIAIVPDSSNHTSYLSRKPREFLCKFFLAGVNFCRFNAKNWHFRQILREKVAFFFTDLTQKIGVFRCKFYSPKILPV